jgi:hypothetical protein
MAYLQLADKSTDAFYQSLAENPKEFYVFVPDSPNAETGSWVREDYFDHLPPAQWNAVMNALEPYQPEMMSAIFDGSGKARREQKKSLRMERKVARTENVKTGNTFGSKLIGGIQNVVGAITGNTAGTDAQTRGLELPTYDIQVGSETPTKKWYENPLVIGGGAILLLGGIYLATKKK